MGSWYTRSCDSCSAELHIHEEWSDPLEPVHPVGRIAAPSGTSVTATAAVHRCGFAVIRTSLRRSARPARPTVRLSGTRWRADGVVAGCVPIAIGSNRPGSVTPVAGRMRRPRNAVSTAARRSQSRRVRRCSVGRRVGSCLGVVSRVERRFATSPSEQSVKRTCWARSSAKRMRPMDA